MTAGINHAAQYVGGDGGYYAYPGEPFHYGDRRRSDLSSIAQEAARAREEAVEIPVSRAPSHPLDEKLAQKKTKYSDHLSIVLGPPVIILLDLVVPCIIYYIWFNAHKTQRNDACRPFTDKGQTCPYPVEEFDEAVLGYTIISFGLGELYVLIARVCRLLWRRDECAPLLSRSRWELDATSWVYAVSMIFALIPFVVASSFEMPELYLYSPGFLMTFLGVIMIITLIPFPIPIGIDSQPRGTRLRPFIYYAAEDFIAVDGLQGRDFRIRYNARYDQSQPFRNMFRALTLWWLYGVLLYLGSVSAVIWLLPFHHAFGLSLGVLFSWIIIWGVVTHIWVQIDMRRQRRALGYAVGARSRPEMLDV